MKYKLVSLFSGCGGLDLGFCLTGSFEVVWANDIFEPACRTFSKNFGLELATTNNIVVPSVAVGDVSLVDFSKIASPGEIDVITGGPPCQDFSIIRGGEKRRGIEVKRGKLYTYFVRALAVLQPKIFVFENVKGLASANRGVALRQIIDDFENLKSRWTELQNTRTGGSAEPQKQGYELIFSSVVDFSKIGVPQKRERIIIIGLRKDLLDGLSSAGIDVTTVRLWVARRLEGAGEIFSTFPLTPLEVFEGKVLTDLNDEYRNCMLAFENYIRGVNSIRAKEYLSSVWSTYKFEVWHDYLVSNGLVPEIDDRVRQRVAESHVQLLQELGYFGKPISDLHFDDGSNEIPKEKDSIKERMKRIPPGENHEFVRGTEYEVTGLMSNIYRRLHPLVPSPTVIAMGGGGTYGYHYLIDRQKLTNRERARLQTFPDTFKFEGNFSEVRRQIGEAVPPLAGKRIAEVVLRVLRAVGSC
jgi:DNA (cytosine-5)-methyltransferase 1